MTEAQRQAVLKGLREREKPSEWDTVKAMRVFMNRPTEAATVHELAQEARKRNDSC